MKQISKITLFVFLTVLCAFSVCVSAEEGSAQVPQEWIEQYSELYPNSETAIRAKFPDIPDNWSTDALIKAVQNGLLNGTDGYLLPDERLTRAQLAAVMVRAFGASEEADVTEFVDLVSDKWYYSDMAKAVKMDIFRGDGTGVIRPDDSITRQEVFTVISRAFNIIGSDAAVLDTFADGASVAEWAKDATASLVAQGYITGADGYLNPENPITRAEFAQIMKNLVDAYITEEGVYTTIPEGNIVIRATGVVLDGVALTGNVYIGEGVGKSITFSNVTSPYRVVIRGGTGTVLTGSYENITVVGIGLTVNASGAQVKTSSSVSGSVLLVENSSGTGWGTAGNESGTGVITPNDQDGDGWVDGWY